jgi:hypothetical protein
MLMFYLPIIIFGAMLDAVTKQNVPASIDEPPSFD